ncbi:MAG: phytanoyl-CoA dioxygenase family protein [Opitutales bacterium]
MSTQSETYRIAPPGFTREQWDTFERDGFLIFENAISDEEVDRYIEAIHRKRAEDSRASDDGHWAPQNFVELDPVFSELIDHPRHIGYAYDIFGELTKLHESQIFCRPGGQREYNKWHPDGGRALPYGVFSPRLPLCIKIGYWLTDLPHEMMGNFVGIPGSHRTQYCDGYDTHETMPGQMVLQVPRGTMTIMNSNLWHMVQPNQSDVTRLNFFLAYCPSWITPSDRFHSDPEWLQTLNREQRILMRSYHHAYDNAKPKPSEFPLFLDRETGADRDPGKYREHVGLSRRKRITQAEKFLAESMQPA